MPFAVSQLKDGKTKKVIGSTVIKLKDLLAAEDMVMDQKFRIKTREEGSSVHMRLCMRVGCTFMFLYTGKINVWY